jgi:hypothetical protein
MSELRKILLIRENLFKLGLMVFGLTLFPGIFYFVGKVFITSSKTIFDFYSYFYGSLLDMGQDGLIAWGIACGPYLLYEAYLLLQGFFPKRRLKTGERIRN